MPTTATSWSASAPDRGGATRRRAHRTSTSRPAAAWAAGRPMRPPCCAGPGARDVDLAAVVLGADIPFCLGGRPAGARARHRRARRPAPVRGRQELHPGASRRSGARPRPCTAAWDELGGPEGREGANDLENPRRWHVEPRAHAEWRDRIREAATGRTPVPGRERLARGSWRRRVIRSWRRPSPTRVVVVHAAPSEPVAGRSVDANDREDAARAVTCPWRGAGTACASASSCASSCACACAAS